MEMIQIIILSIVEGVTEFLPVSSTGHLILTAKLLNIPQTDFVKSFEIIIQSGAILAVVALFGKKLVSDTDLLKKTAAAFIPTGIIGFLLYKPIKNMLIGNEIVTIASLFLGGIAIIGLEIYFKRKEIVIARNPDLTEVMKQSLDSSRARMTIRDRRAASNTARDDKRGVLTLSYKNAFLIGLFQSISVIPGVSRAAATIFGGMLTGLNRKAAVEFSFMLAIPTMAATTGYDLLKNASSFNSSQFFNLGLGLAFSFIFALLAVKWLLRFVQTNTFIPFGVYRIIIAIFFLLLVL